MQRITDNTEVHRIPILDEAECEDVASRLDSVSDQWIRRSGHFFTLGAATYLDVCGDGGSIERYRSRMATGNPVLETIFGDLLETIHDSVREIIGAPCEFAADLARPGFHVFLAGALDETKRDVLHLDLQHLHLPISADLYSPSLTFTLPIEMPEAGAGLELCRPVPTDKRGQLSVEPYRLGELLVHSGRTLHRRAHMPATSACRRVTLQGHAVHLEGGGWILYW